SRLLTLAIHPSVSRCRNRNDPFSRVMPMTGIVPTSLRQRFTVPSALEVHSSPSRHARFVTRPPCAFVLLLTRRPETSQTITEPSTAPDASHRPSGLNAT